MPGRTRAQNWVAGRDNTRGIKAVRTVVSFRSTMLSLIYAGHRKDLCVHDTQRVPHSWLGISSQQNIELIRADAVRYYQSETSHAVSPKDQTGRRSQRAPLLTVLTPLAVVIVEACLLLLVLTIFWRSTTKLSYIIFLPGTVYTTCKDLRSSKFLSEGSLNS